MFSIWERETLLRKSLVDLRYLIVKKSELVAEMAVYFHSLLKKDIQGSARWITC